MSTLTVFTPTSAGPFQFSATLDGQDYTCNVTWNLWRQGWYLNIYTTTNSLVVSRVLVPSIAAYPINLVFGYFQTSTLVFDDPSQTFIVTP